MRKFLLGLLLIIPATELAASDSTRLLHDKAIHFSEILNWDSASFYYSKSAAAFLKKNDTSGFVNEKYNEGLCLLSARRYSESEKAFKRILEGFYYKLTSHEKEVNLYHKLSFAQGFQGHFFDAYQTQAKAYQLSLFYDDVSRDLKSQIVDAQASITRTLGFYDEALKFANESLELSTDSLAKSHAYNKIGLIQKRLANYGSSFAYFLKCYELRKKYNPEWVPYVINNIGELLIDSHSYDSATLWLDKGLSISNSLFGPASQLNLIILLNKARAFQLSNQKQKANKTLNEAFDLLPQLDLKNQAPSVYPKIIATALDFERYDLVKKLLNDLQKHVNKNSSNDFIAKFHNSYGKYYAIQGLYDSALWNYNLSINAFKPDSTSNQFIDNAPITQILPYQEALLRRLEVLNKLYIQTKNSQYLKMATVDQDYLLKHIVSNKYEHISLTGASAFFEEKNEFLDLLLAASTELHNINPDQNYLNKISQIMEAKRMNTFKKEFAYNQHNSISGVPDSIMIRRRNLQVRINELQANYNVSSSDEKDKILTLQRELEEIHLLIKEKNKNFYQSIHSQNITLSDIESKLDSNEALIQFSFSNNQLFILVSKNKDSKLTVVYWDDEKEKNINNLIESLRNSNSEMQTISNSVLQDLNWNKLNLDSVKKIQILAEDKLSLIPFEVLVFNGEYLINKHEFVYRTSLIDFENNITGPDNHNFIGFAPFNHQSIINASFNNNPSRKSLGALPASALEVEKIQEIWSGNIFLGSSATESAFKKYAASADMIHFATHAVLDNNNPLNSTIMFSKDEEGEDGLLHTYEILQMKLNARLVTLSACNTGVGKFYKGEGMVSLATGFNIAGVDYIIMSLWPVPDKTTSDIMRDFYQLIKEDLPITEALRKAKLNYLQTHDSNLSHPYYWAGFVVTTDNWSDHKETSKLTLYVIILISLTILFSGFFIYRKNPEILN
ncbi:CHAT domain-containing protein [Fulvivirga sp.]|uniref:CHAT domain-containing protein n=1 Tax=Fulvivirga sp. TaxID=1931237 RepID=UPI0032EF2AC8